MRTAAYQTVWLGTRSKSYGYGFNPYWHGRMLERVHALNRTAVYYSYLIAMLARHTKGIKDCDVGTPSLCVHGADFVRQHEGLILRTYEQYANETALVLGRSAPVVWLMEPDWHQYGEATQRGGGVPQSRMVQLFVAMVGRIKRHLPAALISFDVSPWVSDIEEWMAPFLEHGGVDYVHTSGGRTTANSDRIRARDAGNLLTWAELHRISGRGIIADTGYGVGGKLTDDSQLYGAWTDAEHLRDRIADGVIAVTFAMPNPGWEHRVSRLRDTLPPTRHCFEAASSSGVASGRRRDKMSAASNASTSKRGAHATRRGASSHVKSTPNHVKYFLDGGQYDAPRGRTAAPAAHVAAAATLDD